MFTKTGFENYSDAELENEKYTLQFEARFLELSPDEIELRLSKVETEMLRRLSKRFD